MDAKETIKQAIISGDWEATRDAAQAALDEGLKAHYIMNAMVAGMDIVGAEWQVGNMYIPEVMLAARALHAGLAIIRPFLTDAEIKMRGTVIIGTVQGDLHDIGKSLVAMMLEGASFEVHDLGVDVSPEAFVAAVKEYKPSSKVFRAYKIQKGKKIPLKDEFIQRAKYSLGTRGEVSEIQMAKKSKGKWL